MDSSDAIVALTVALVGVTGYYAWETHRMVNEMRKARATQLLPKLVLTAKSLGGGNGLWRVQNVGPGPATDVDVQIAPEPGGQPRRWKEPVVVPGEVHDFIPATGEQSSEAFLLDNQTKRFSNLRLTGSYRDALGDEHQVDERFDIRDWWEFKKASLERFERDWRDEVPKHLKTIHEQLKKIEAAIASRS